MFQSDRSANARLNRSDSGLLPIPLHTGGEKLIFDGDKCRNRIEIMFGGIEDWRRLATAMIDSLPSFSPQSRSQPPSSSGCDQ